MKTSISTNLIYLFWGGSILSTRCSETYETKTALISLFGIPLWYFSQSPRVVIQVIKGQVNKCSNVILCWVVWVALWGLGVSLQCIGDTGTSRCVPKNGIFLADPGHSLSPTQAKLSLTGSLGGALDLCKVWGLGGKAGPQNTTGSSGGFGVSLKSSTKEIISAPYCFKTVPKNSEFFTTLYYNKNKLENTVTLFLLLCSILFSPPSFCAAGHVSRKLLGFQRITGVSCGEAFHEDLSNCLYIGTYTKNSFTNRKYYQCS